MTSSIHLFTQVTYQYIVKYCKNSNFIGLGVHICTTQGEVWHGKVYLWCQMSPQQVEYYAKT